MQLPDYDIVADRDYFFTITADGVTEDKATIIEHVIDNAPAILMRGHVATYPGTLTVYNIEGRVVASGKDNVKLDHLSRGIYIVQGRTAGHVSTIKCAVD